MIRCSSLVIIPKGSIIEMINVIVSAKVLCDENKIKLFVIWEHDCPYHDLFLNPLCMIKKDFLFGKEYVYNPSLEPTVFLQHIEFNTDEERYLVLETKHEIMDNRIPFRHYIIRRHEVYIQMIQDDLSGVVVGQMGLYDVPINFIIEFGSVNSGENNKNTNTTKFEDLSFGNTISNEYTDFLRLLVCSKAKLLISSGVETDKLSVYASNIFMKPLICIEVDSLQSIPTVTAKTSSYPKPYEYICNPIPLKYIENDEFGPEM